MLLNAPVGTVRFRLNPRCGLWALRAEPEASRKGMMSRGAVRRMEPPEWLIKDTSIGWAGLRQGASLLGCTQARSG